MNIHPTALIDPTAVLGRGAEVGPFAIVEAGVRLGEGCRLAGRATVKSGVTMGSGNFVGEGAVVGGLPQHVAPPGPPGRVVVGDRNMFRENVTVHRAMQEEGVTRIGSDCMFMVASHVAHDCEVDDGVVLTNNVMLAGHVTIGSKAFLGGGSAVHQFCRVGRLAMIGGMARVTQDVPPFVTIDGGTGAVVGLNRVGLRRAGIDRNQIREIKAAYQLIYRSGLAFSERLEGLAEGFSSGPAAEFEPFLRETSRGFARERRSPPGGTIRVLDDARDLDTPAADTAAKRRVG